MKNNKWSIHHSVAMITKMQVLCMFLLMPGLIIATGQKDKYVNQRLATPGMATSIFRYEAFRIWKCLPNDLHKVENYGEFRRRLRVWGGLDYSSLTGHISVVNLADDVNFTGARIWSKCVYPKYLREGPWIDQTSNPGYEFSFGDSIFKEHKDVIHGRMNWTCVKTLKEGDNDIVLSKAHVFSNQVLFRCELYRKVDTGNVFYKTLAAPEFLRGRECAICGGKGNARAEKVHILRTSQAEPLPGVNDWGCGEQNCTWCSSQPTQEEDTGSLQDEARSLESILRKWFSDTKVRG